MSNKTTKAQIRDLDNLIKSIDESMPCPKGVVLVYSITQANGEPQGVGINSKGRVVAFEGESVRPVTLRESVKTVERYLAMAGDAYSEQWGTPGQNEWLKLIAQAL